jgi:hypothetical protein
MTEKIEDKEWMCVRQCYHGNIRYRVGMTYWGPKCPNEHFVEATERMLKMEPVDILHEQLRSRNVKFDPSWGQTRLERLLEDRIRAEVEQESEEKKNAKKVDILRSRVEELERQLEEAKGKESKQTDREIEKLLAGYGAELVDVEKASYPQLKIMAEDLAKKRGIDPPPIHSKKDVYKEFILVWRELDDEKKAGETEKDEE